MSYRAQDWPTNKVRAIKHARPQGDGYIHSLFVPPVTFYTGDLGSEQALLHQLKAINQYFKSPHTLN